MAHVTDVDVADIDDFLYYVERTSIQHTLPWSENHLSPCLND